MVTVSVGESGSREDSSEVRAPDAQAGSSGVCLRAWGRGQGTLSRVSRVRVR